MGNKDLPPREHLPVLNQTVLRQTAPEMWYLLNKTLRVNAGAQPHRGLSNLL